MTDEEYMRLAIDLSKEARGYTAPNPLVGAIVVKEGRIIGQGYHHKAGTAHAEVHAIKEASEPVDGATLYVTLEPCAHFGRTPPCADLIVEHKIKRVVVGCMDQNPKVQGKGIEKLKAAGIEVTVGILEQECYELNKPFFTYISKKRPYVSLKAGLSLDGKIATSTGQSQWITNEEARNDGHRLRGMHDAILVGIGTVLADNPTLSCRYVGQELPQPPHQPTIVVLDGHGRLPADAQILEQNRKVLVFIGPDIMPNPAIMAKGANILNVPRQGEYLSVEAILEILGQQGITSVLVEGGGKVLSSFVYSGLYDKAYWYVSNRIIGGQLAPSVIGGQGITELKDTPYLRFTAVRPMGDNLCIETEPLNMDWR